MPAQFRAAHTLSVEWCFPAFFILRVDNAVIEYGKNFFVRHTLDYKRIYVLVFFLALENIFLGIGRI